MGERVETESMESRGAVFLAYPPLAMQYLLMSKGTLRALYHNALLLSTCQKRHFSANRRSRMYHSIFFVILHEAVYRGRRVDIPVFEYLPVNQSRCSGVIYHTLPCHPASLQAHMRDKSRHYIEVGALQTLS